MGRLTKGTILRLYVQQLRRAVQLLRESHASTMEAMNMLVEFPRNNGRSDSGNAEGGAAVRRFHATITVLVTTTPLSKAHTSTQLVTTQIAVDCGKQAAKQNWEKK